MRVIRGVLEGARLGRLAAVIAVGILAMTAAAGPAQAQQPVDCDTLNIELVDMFTSPICYKTRFRGSGTIGRSESIHGETPDYMINFQFARSGSGYTYLSALDFEMLMDYYGLTGGLEILGAEREVRDGFDYVTVGGEGLDSCILFLKQTRPIRGGYRARYFGIACDKRQVGEYSPADAAELLDLIKNY